MIISPIIILYTLKFTIFQIIYKLQLTSFACFFIMDPAFLHHFRDTQNQALLDRLQSLNRQLFFIFGRESNQERKQLIEREISGNKKIIQFIQSYQKYQALQKEQKKLHLCEEQTGNLEIELTKRKNEQTERRNQLLEVKKKQLKLLQALKKGEEAVQRIHRYDAQIEAIENIGEQIRPKQIAAHLPVLNSIKSQILQQKQLISNKIKDMQEKTRILRQIKQKEDIKYDSLLKQKFNLAKQFESFKGYEIMRRSKAQRSKLQPKNEQFRVAKRIFNHRRISEKVKVPLCYWCWLILLVVWTLALYFLPKVMKPSECY